MTAADKDHELKKRIKKKKKLGKKPRLKQRVKLDFTCSKCEHIKRAFLISQPTAVQHTCKKLSTKNQTTNIVGKMNRRTGVLVLKGIFSKKEMKMKVQMAKVHLQNEIIMKRKTKMRKILAIDLTKHAKRTQEFISVVKNLIRQIVEIQTMKRDVEEKITKLKNENLHAEKKSTTRKIHATFCICNLPTSDKKPPTPMVECSNCLRWYHFACIGLTVEDVYGLTRWDCHACELRLPCRAKKKKCA